MGYQIVAGATDESLSDEVWLDLIALANKYDFSAPRRGHLGQREDTDLTEEEVVGLHTALERALSAGEPSETISPEDETIDRDTVHRVTNVLRQPGGKTLRRTPPWR